jgi:hypothetical protein
MITLNNLNEFNPNNKLLIDLYKEWNIPYINIVIQIIIIILYKYKFI